MVHLSVFQVEAAEQRAKPRKKDDMDIKLEDFYSDLDSEEKDVEKLASGKEDVEQLIVESKVLVEKVDTLMDILLRAAHSPDETDELLHKIYDAVDQLSDNLAQLSELREKVELIPEVKDSIEQLSQRLDSIVDRLRELPKQIPQLDELSAAVKQIPERIDVLEGKLSGLPSITERMKTLSDEIKTVSETTEHTLRGVKAVYRKVKILPDIKEEQERIAERIRRLESAIEGLPAGVAVAVSEAEEEHFYSLIQQVDELSKELKELSRAIDGARAAVVAEVQDSREAQLSVIHDLLVKQQELEQRLEDLRSAAEKIPEIHSTVSSLPQQLGTVVRNELQPVSDVDERLEHIEERLRTLDKELAEVLSLQKSESAELSALESEISALQSATEALQKAFSSSIDERREAVSTITNRLSELVAKITDLSERLPADQQDRLQKLQQSIVEILSTIQLSVDKLTEAEQSERELLEHHLSLLSERISALEQRLQNPVLPPEELQSIKDELAELSNAVAAVSDVVGKNHSLLSAHSGKVMDLLTRIDNLSQQVSQIEAQLSQPRDAEIAQSVSEMSKRLAELEQMLVQAQRDLRELKDHDHVKSLDSINQSLSIIHSELTGIVELLRKYDTTGRLKKIEEQLTRIESDVRDGRADVSAVSKELARAEEELSKISTVLSEADVKGIKNALREVHSALKEIHDSLKGAHAVIDERELRELVSAIAELKAHIYEIRDSGVSDAVRKLKEELEKLHEQVSKDVSAISAGNVYHANVSDAHAPVKSAIKKVMPVARAVGKVGREKRATATNISAAAERIADATGSAQAHSVAALSKHVARTGKDLEDVDALVRRVAKLAESVDAEIQKKSELPSKKEAKALVTRVDPVKLAVPTVAKYLRSLPSGAVTTTAKIAEDLQMSEDVVKQAVEQIASAGEIPLKVSKPALAFLSSAHWKIIRA